MLYNHEDKWVHGQLSPLLAWGSALEQEQHALLSNKFERKRIDKFVPGRFNYIAM